MKGSLAVAFLAAALLAGACGSRRHLQDDMGRSYLAVFENQGKGKRDPAQSPSTMEANVANYIHQGYALGFKPEQGAGDMGGGDANAALMQASGGAGSTGDGFKLGGGH